MKKTFAIEFRVCLILAIAGWLIVFVRWSPRRLIFGKRDALMERLASGATAQQLGPKLIAAFDSLKEGQTIYDRELAGSALATALSGQPVSYVFRDEARLTGNSVEGLVTSESRSPD